MSKPLKIVLFLGTCREGRLGLRVAKFMINEVKKRGHEVEFFGKVVFIVFIVIPIFLCVYHSGAEYCPILNCIKV